MSDNDSALRGVWLAIIVLAGLLAAIVAGMVFRAAGTELTEALQAGGATFLSVVTLGLAARKFLTG